MAESHVISAKCYLHMYDSSPHALTQKLQERQASFSITKKIEKSGRRCLLLISCQVRRENVVMQMSAWFGHFLGVRIECPPSFITLDYRSIDGKTPQAKRQMKSRRIGNASLRMRPSMAPDGKILPSWLFKVTC